MPELPEIETIKKQITPFLPLEIVNITFSKFSNSILLQKEFSPKKFIIKEINRKGKMLIFLLFQKNHPKQNHYILSHFGMSGGWRISYKKIIEKHTHIQFKTKNSKNEEIFLAYVDPRRFGSMYFFKEKKALIHINKIGVDISSADFSVQYISSLIKKFPNKMIKPFLLDQK